MDKCTTCGSSRWKIVRPNTPSNILRHFPLKGFSLCLCLPKLQRTWDGIKNGELILMIQVVQWTIFMCTWDPWLKNLKSYRKEELILKEILLDPNLDFCFKIPVNVNPSLWITKYFSSWMHIWWKNLSFGHYLYSTVPLFSLLYYLRS